MAAATGTDLDCYSLDVGAVRKVLLEVFSASLNSVRNSNGQQLLLPLNKNFNEGLVTIMPKHFVDSLTCAESEIPHRIASQLKNVRSI